MLNSLYLVLFLGFLQSLSKTLQGVIHPADFFVGISEKFNNRRVIVRKLHGSLQLFHCPLIIPPLIIDPSQAVDIEPVIGLRAC